MTSHVLVVPEQSPLHSTKLEPESAAAVRVTVLPAAKSFAQVAPQVIELSPLEIVPVPVLESELATASVKVTAAIVTACGAESAAL